MRLAIIDYGAGNCKSVQFAFERLGIKSVITNDLMLISSSDGVIFPGVGHAEPAMKALKQSGLDLLIPELKQPVLGICLGMQLLCKKTAEGNQKGLEIFDSKVIKFAEGQRIPQMGWNSIQSDSNPLLIGIEDSSFLYFVHSYYVPLNSNTIARTEYGLEFSAAMSKDNFYGCQFHPEKSGAVGEKILMNFMKICESYQQ